MSAMRHSQDCTPDDQHALGAAFCDSIHARPWPLCALVDPSQSQLQS